MSLTTKVRMPSLSALRPERSATPRSSAERLWLLGGVLAAAVLVLIGYLALIGPQRSTTDAVHGDVAAARTQEQALQLHIAALRNDAKNLPKYEAQLAAAHAAMPSGSGVPDLLRELQAIGAATSTTITSVSVGAPVAVTATAGTATGTAAGAAASGAPTAQPTTAAPAPAVAAGAPAPTGVYSMAVSTSVAGSAAGLDKFLQQLQEVQPRAVLITQLTESATSSADGKAPSGSTLSLAMLAFMKPGSTTATPAP